MSRAAVMWGAATVLCVLFGLSHSYSSMAIYDDESYIMMTIKTFLEGDRLYAETYTQYGPAYYMLQQPIHGWLGVPITHDVMRLKTVVTWVMIGLFSGVLIAKLTQNRFAGMTAMMVSVLHLQKLGLEPAHPQEVVALLMAIAMLLMSFRNRGLLFAVGVCAALAGLAKLNVGAVVAVGCLFAAGFEVRQSRGCRHFFTSVGSLVSVGLAMSVFAAIAKTAFANSQPGLIVWPLVILVSALLVSFAAWRNRKPQTSDSGEMLSVLQHPFMMICFGGIVGSMAVLTWAMVHGNSLQEILHGVVLQHGFMADSFYHPIHADRFGLLFAICAASLLTLRFWKNSNVTVTDSIDKILFRLPAVVVFIAMAQMAIECCKPLSHGLEPRGAAFFLATAGPAMMPILLLKSSSQLRRSLAMIGCLSPIFAFPVPGTQVSLGTLPILAGLIVAAHDAMLPTMSASLSKPRFKQSLIGVAVVMVLATSVFGYRWATNVALDQPGCRWVRLEAKRAAEEIALAEIIRDAESPWLAFDSHNHNRFFFWTDKKPLTSTSPTFWPAMLTESQKSQIEFAAREADSICVVRVSNERVKLEDYAPSIERAFFESWRIIEAAGDWQVGITQ